MIISLLLAQAQLERMAHTPVAYADTVQFKSAPLYLEDRVAAIQYWADTYKVDSAVMSGVIKCESGGSPNAVGDGGDSIGLVQVNLPAHKDVTRSMALDPDWSLRFLASQVSIGNAHIWTCFRLLYEKPAT